MALTEQDMLRVIAIAKANPENPEILKKSKAAAIAYRRQQEGTGQPLFPTAEKARQEQGRKIETLFTNRETHGLPADSLERINENFRDNPDEKYALFNRKFLESQGIPKDRVAALGDELLAKYSAKVWGEEVRDPKAFYDRMGEEIDVRNDLSKRAMKQNMAGTSLMAGLAGIESEKGEDPRFKARKKDWLAAYEKSFTATDAVISPYRELIDQTANALRDKKGLEAARQMRGVSELEDTPSYSMLATDWMSVPEQHLDFALQAVVEKSQSEEDPDKINEQKLFERLYRGGESWLRGTTATVRRREIENVRKILNSDMGVPPEMAVDPDGFFAGLQEVKMLDPIFVANQATQKGKELTQIPEEVKAQISEKLDENVRRIDLIRRLANVANNGIDPATSDSLATRGILGAAESLPYMIVAMAPLGMLANIDALTETAHDQLSVNSPQLTESQKNQISSIAGPISAALELIPASILRGTFPTVGRWMNKAVVTGGSLAVRGGMRGVEQLGAELFAENSQALSPFAIQSLIAAFSEDMPSVEWDPIITETIGQQPELIATIIPILLFGGGSGTASDFNTARNFIANPNYVAMITGDTATAWQIADLGRKGKFAEAQTLLRAEMQRTGHSAKAIQEVRREAVQKVALEAESQRNAFKQGQDLDIIPDIVNEGEQWSLRFKDGTSAKFETYADAQVRLDQHLSDSILRLHESAVSTIRTVSGGIEAGRGLRYLFSPEAPSSRDQVDQGVVTEAEATESVDLAEGLSPEVVKEFQEAEVMSGLAASSPEDRLATARVIGSSQNEYVDGIVLTTMRLYQGFTVATILEEKFEGDAKFIIQQQGNRKWMIRALREWEQISGDKLLFGDDDKLTNRNLVEAWSKFGISYFATVSEDGEGKSLPFNRTQAQKLLNSSLSGASTGYASLFNSILKRVAMIEKAKAEGVLNADFEDVILRSTGMSEQTRFDRSVKREAETLAGEVGATFSVMTDAGNPSDFSDSRATPEDASNLTVLPDGSRLVGPTTFSILAHHGTPHKVDKFSLDKIGTGEGAQAYGWGLYFAESKKVAEQYRKDLSGYDELTIYTKDGKKKGANIDGVDLDAAKYLELGERAAGQFKHNALYYAKQLAEKDGLSEVVSRLDQYGRDAKVSYEKNTGTLYTVELLPNADEFLDYDGEMTDEQAARIAPLFKGNGTSRKVSFAYNELSSGAGEAYGGGTPELASRLLASVGIPGIRFLDGNSRDNGEGTSNYVIFDDSLVKILEENGRKVETGEVSFSVIRFDEIAREDPMHDASRVGTAWQGKVRPTTQDTNNGIGTVVPKELKKQMAMLTHFIEGVPLPKYITKFRNAEKRMRAFIEFQKGNLLALYDAFEELSSDYVTRSTHWYDGARLMAEEMRDRYSITVEQAAATIAVFSPMKDWFQNVAMGQRFSDVMANHKETPILETEMGDAMRTMFDSAENQDAVRVAFTAIEGNSISQLLTDTSKEGRKIASVAIRLMSTHVHGLNHDVLSPEGESLGIRKNLDGSNKTLVWQSYAFIEKALSIYEDGSLNNISRVLGTEHKIRNFYNNIVSPTSPYGDATVDTHAVNAGVLFPMGNKGYLVGLNFGDAGVAGGGNSGLYWIFHEALREAAAERGVMPRQMQSITWEAIRGLFTDVKKRDKNFIAEIARIWQDSSDAGTARSQIIGLGITAPEWSRVVAGNPQFEGSLGESVGQVSGSAGGVRSGVRQGGKGRNSRDGVTFSVLPDASNLDSEISDLFNVFQRTPELRMKLGQVMREKAIKAGQEFAPLFRAYRTKGSIDAERKRRVEEIFSDKLGSLDATEIGALEAESAVNDMAMRPILSELLRRKAYKRKDGKTVEYWAGSLMSKAEANRRGINTKGGEWDDIPEGLPPYVWGGSIMPDQAASMFGMDSTDQFWTALSQEIASWQDRKADVEAVNKRIAEFRREARAEAKEWADGAMNARETVATDRAVLLAGLRTLDAITRALPAEVRGKIGGSVAIAQLRTPQAILDEIESRVGKVDRELERYLKKEADERVKKLFERAKPAKDESGKARKGKAGAEIHSLFDVAREAWKTWSADKAEAHAVGLEAEIAKGELSPEWEAHKMLEVELVRSFGGWKDADSIRKTHALETATEIWDRGYLEYREKKAREKERRDGIRADLRKDTGKAGKKSERALTEIAGVKLPGRARDFFLSLLNFEQLTQWAFGKESQWAQWFADEQRKAENAKLDAVQAVTEGVEDLFTELAGGNRFKGEQLQFRMMQRSLTATAADGDVVPLSELEALSALLMWQQEDGKRHLRGKRDENGAITSEWAYDDAFIEEISSKLSDEAWKVLGYLQAEYGKEYGPLNAVYREIYGINLPQNANYSPLTVKPTQAPAGQTADPLTGSTISSGSFTPGSLRSRAQVSAEPDFRDAVATFIAHKKQIEHWKTHARFVLDANAVLGNREVGNSIEAAHGQEAVKIIRKWLDAIAQGGVRNAAADTRMMKLLEEITGRFAGMALVGRIGTIAIQSTQLAAASALMPTGAYVVRLGKLLSGNLGWGIALDSPYIRRRVDQQPVMVQAAMQGLRAGKPTQIKHQVRKLGSLLNGADALFTAGTYAIAYDYHFTQATRGGMDAAEAARYATETAERVMESVAQPTRLGTRSFFEVSTSNPLGRLAWAFASDARKNLGLLGFNWGKGNATDKYRATLFVIVLSGLMSSVIRSAWRDMRDGDDDEIFDEKYWSAKRILLPASTEWLFGFPVIGEEIQNAIYSLSGEYTPSSGSLSAIAQAPVAAKNILTGDSTDLLRDVEKVLTGIGLFSDNTAAATSVMHLVRDIYGLGENFTGE